jgi:predicted Zn-dependent peptidase
MVQYFDRRYAPSNMVLVATGNIDWDKFCKEAEQLCSHWAPQPVTREAIPFRRSIMQEQVIYKRPNLQQGHILFLTPGCAYLDDAKYSLGILASIVGDSMGSRLYWELVDSGIAEYAGAENECKDGVGSFGVFASTRPTDIDKVRDIILKVLSSLTDFSDEDLERAKNKTLAHLILSGESAMGRMLALGRYWVNTQKLHSIEETIKKVSDVTRETINDALKKYPLDKWCEYQLLPE